MPDEAGFAGAFGLRVFGPVCRELGWALFLEESGMDVFTESYLRANVVAWLPVGREDCVLYIGEEDVIAGKLREMAGDVVCAADAAEGCGNRLFDFVVCLGNWGKAGLQEFCGCLKDTGKLVLAAENAYGLKFLAGAKGIGQKGYFGAVEGCPDAGGVTKEELLDGLSSAGFGSWEFFYPFPDYAFAMSVFSDAYLPKAGELIDQVGNFEAERLVLFDESKAADALVARGKFGDFSSAFLVVAGKGAACPVLNEEGERILFVKFSNDRGVSRNIRTYVTESADGMRHLVKMADTKAADAQILNMGKTAKALAELYADSKFSVNACKMRSDCLKRSAAEEIRLQENAVNECKIRADNEARKGCSERNALEKMHLQGNAEEGENLCREAAKEPNLQERDGKKDGTADLPGQAAEFVFLQGRTMEEILDGMLSRGEYDGAAEQLSEVLAEILKCRGQQEFCMSEEFREVFGDVKLPDGLLAASASDIDMILSNILVDGDGGWTLIDYEWSFHFPIPLRFILYRCIRYYADTTEARKKLCAERFYRSAGITEQELLAYEEMEEAFQAYVLDGHVPLRTLYREYGKPAYHVSSLLNLADEQERRRALQVYFDRGNGFSEEESVLYRSKALDGTYHLHIPVGEGVRGIRIDPGSQACTVEMKRLCFLPCRAGVMDFISNGHKLAEDMYLFDTEDPNILLTRLPGTEATLVLDLRIDSMSLAAAEWIAPKIDAKYRLKKMWKK